MKWIVKIPLKYHVSTMGHSWHTAFWTITSTYVLLILWLAFKLDCGVAGKATANVPSSRFPCPYRTCISSFRPSQKVRISCLSAGNNSKMSTPGCLHPWGVWICQIPMTQSVKDSPKKGKFSSKSRKRDCLRPVGNTSALSFFFGTTSRLPGRRKTFNNQLRSLYNFSHSSLLK